uniref:Uncharacterized protein n=1 Tax=Zea mays TaxID=4577 RepID=A0A804QMA1_MAIZE
MCCVLHDDRFIPDRSAMDMDMAHYLLTEPRKDKENVAGMVASPSKEAYRRLLAGKLFNNRTQILAFRNKLPEPENMSITNVASSNLRILNPAFHHEKIKGMMPVFSTCCIEMITRWDNSMPSEGSSEIDVWPEF